MNKSFMPLSGPQTMVVLPTMQRTSTPNGPLLFEIPPVTKEHQSNARTMDFLPTKIRLCY